MIDPTASTRQPPAGGPGRASTPDALLPELRRGERDAFVRYFALFRAPVYSFAVALLEDEDEAASATSEALTACFRRVILEDVERGLEALTYRCAYDACGARADRAAEHESSRSPAGQAARRLTVGSGRGPAGESRRAVVAALAALDLRSRAALLLRDLAGFAPADLACVFDTSEEAAGILLFRAREAFRTAYGFGAAQAGGGRCRQADRVLAGAVGIGLAEEEARRLRDHASYCRPCRRALRSWNAGPVGLATALAPEPPPQALATPPVFAVEASAVSTPVTVATARRVRRVVAGRTFAYVLAAACLAIAVGVLMHSQTLRPPVLFESVGPAIRLVTGDDEDSGAGPVEEGTRKVRSTNGTSRLLSAGAVGRETLTTTASLRQTSDGQMAASAQSDDAASGRFRDGGETPTSGGGDAATPGEDGGDATATAGGGSSGEIAGSSSGGDGESAAAAGGEQAGGPSAAAWKERVRDRYPGGDRDDRMPGLPKDHHGSARVNKDHHGSARVSKHHHGSARTANDRRDRLTKDDRRRSGKARDHHRSRSEDRDGSRKAGVHRDGSRKAGVHRDGRRTGAARVARRDDRGDGRRRAGERSARHERGDGRSPRATGAHHDAHRVGDQRNPAARWNRSSHSRGTGHWSGRGDRRSHGKHH